MRPATAAAALLTAALAGAGASHWLAQPATPAETAPPMTAQDLVTLPRLGAPAVNAAGTLAIYGVTTTDPESLARSTGYYLLDLTKPAAAPVETVAAQPAQTDAGTPVLAPPSVPTATGDTVRTVDTRVVTPGGPAEAATAVAAPAATATEVAAATPLRVVEGSMDKDKALAAALSQIERNFGKGTVMRFGEAPACDGSPLPAADRELIMHMEVSILGGHVLMGTDAPASMGFTLVQGNNSYLNLEPDSRAETDRLFAALGEGGHD